MTDSPREITRVDDLVEIANLADVYFLEIAAKRAYRDAELDSDSGIEAMLRNLNIATRVMEDEAFEARFRILIEAPQADIVVDVVTTYALNEPAVLLEAVTQEFVQRVAIMAAWPFIRSQVFLLASQLGIEVPVLPLIKQGMLALEKSDAETFGDE